MKISCDVIKDILPLYVEDMVSKDTKELVQEHICGCDGCRGELESICTAAKIPVDTDTRVMRRLEKGLRRRRWWTVVTAVILMLTIVTGVMMYLAVPVWLTAEEAVKSIEAQEDGTLILKTANPYAGIVEECYWNDDINYSIIFRYYRFYPFDGTVGAKDYHTFGNEYIYKHGQQVYGTDCNIYYIDYRDGTAEAVLWKGGGELLTGSLLEDNYPIRSDPSWLLKDLCYGALGLFIVFAVLGALLRKFRWGKWFMGLAVLCGSFVGADLLLTSGRFLAIDKSDLIMKTGCISSLAVLFFAAILCCNKVHSLRK